MAEYSYIDGRCYKIYRQARLSWANASQTCSRDLGRLAMVNTTAQLQGLSALLETLNLDIAKERLYLDRLSIDLDSWTWMDGSPIDSALWKSGYPIENNKKTCLVLDKNEPAIKNIPCDRHGDIGLICQSREGKLRQFL